MRGGRPFSYQEWEVVRTEKACPANHPNVSTEHIGYCYKNGSNINWPEDFTPAIDQDIYGWVTHNYNGLNWDTEGQKIWRNGCTISSETDLCTNLEGSQTVMPEGYEDPNEDGICTEIDNPVDLCTNLEGNQTVIPEGYEDQNQDGICTSIEEPTDLCPNLEGTQTEIPENLVLDEEGNCVVPEGKDICPNIEGNQETLPEDYFIHPKTKECIEYTHGGPDEPEITPQVLGESISAESLPVGGGNWLFYQSLLLLFGFLFASMFVNKLLPKSR